MHARTHIHTHTHTHTYTHAYTRTHTHTHARTHTHTHTHKHIYTHTYTHTRTHTHAHTCTHTHTHTPGVYYSIDEAAGGVSFASNPKPINYGLEAGDIVFAVFGSILLVIVAAIIVLGFFIHPFFLS